MLCKFSARRSQRYYPAINARDEDILGCVSVVFTLCKFGDWRFIVVHTKIKIVVAYKKEQFTSISLRYFQDQPVSDTSTPIRFITGTYLYKPWSKPMLNNIQRKSPYGSLGWRNSRWREKTHPQKKELVHLYCRPPAEPTDLEDHVEEL